MGSRAPLLWPELRVPFPIGDRQERAPACQGVAGIRCVRCVPEQKGALSRRPAKAESKQRGWGCVSQGGRNLDRADKHSRALQLRVRGSQGRVVLPGQGRSLASI